MSNNDFASTTFKDKPDMSMIWLRHMDRVNQSSSGDVSFQAYVRTQLRLLPTQSQGWIETQKEFYEEEKDVLVYKTFAGIRQGTLDSPIRNDETIPYQYMDEENTEIDLDDPNIISPKIKKQMFTDYEALHLLILQSAEKDGLSWKVQIHTRDMGDVDKTKKKPNQAPLAKTSTGKKYANNPSGSNTKIISTIPDTNLSITDWHGTKIVEGPGYGPLFLNMIQTRTNVQKGTIIGMGGPPGEGKTWFSMRLAEILNRVNKNRKFNPYLQIPFEIQHFLWLLSDDSPLEPGDVIVLDEAHFAAGSRNWFKEDQKELVSMIASARNMGYIIILVVLHMAMLDNMLRNFTMAFYVHLESVGLATTYLTYTTRFNPKLMKNTIGPITLMVPGISECPHPFCLQCKSLYARSEDHTICYAMRPIYERRKKFFQNRNISNAKARHELKKKSTTSANDMIDTLEEFNAEILLTSHGNVDPASVQIIIDRELGVSLGKHKARDIAKRYQILHPESVNNTNG